MAPDPKRMIGSLPNPDRKSSVRLQFVSAFLGGLLAFRALWSLLIFFDPYPDTGHFILAFCFAPPGLVVFGVAGCLIWARIMAPIDSYGWNGDLVGSVSLGILCGSAIGILTVAGGL
jgi:hypothetical protein